MKFFEYFIQYYINQKFGWTYILTELISCFVISFSFNNGNPKDFRFYLKLFSDFAFTWILEVLISCFFYWVLYINGQDTTSMRYFVYPLVALIHTIYPKDIGKYIMRFTCAIFSSSFVFMAINLSGALGTMITDFIGHYPNNILFDYTLYIVLLGLIGISVLFKLLSPFRYKFVKPLPVLLVDTVFVLSYIVTICSGVIGKNINPLFNCILYTMLLVISFLCYTIFYLNVKNYNKVIDYQMKAMKAESEANQLEISASQYEELHRIRHELKNQMSLLEQMFKEKKYEEMNEYFADISEKVHVTIDYIDSGNSLVNAVLNMELSKAKSAGIPFDTHLSIVSDLPIDPQDMTSLLSNLIDNAIEAEARDNLKDRIDIHMIYQNEYLFLKVTNSVKAMERNEVPSLKSKKSDRKNHGYGTKIIRSICHKYNGYAKFTLQENKFLFDGMLYLPRNVK